MNRINIDCKRENKTLLYFQDKRRLHIEEDETTVPPLQKIN